MSATEQEQEQGTLVLADDPQIRSLVQQGMEKVREGKIRLADLFDQIAKREDPEVPDKRPPVSPSLTEKQTKALERLPQVYGRVVVTADRKLTTKELTTLVEEREIISTILTPLEKRKTETIREILSNHLDHLVPEEERPSARKDRKGHFAVKQEVSVEGTGKKVQRSVSGGKPVLSIQHIEDLHAQGQIDRKTYLAITRKPDLPRVLDEDGLHKAIQKDPRLFFLLGSVATPTNPTTTINVANDS